MAGAYLAKEEALRSGDLTGHLDIRAWHSDYGEAIIDLKTGQIGTAWLQVGGYIDLLGSNGERGYPIGGGKSRRRAARAPRAD